MIDLIAAQLTDVFRIGLVIGLLVTALRTRAATGLAVPLAAGIAFIAVIIPTTTGAGAPFWPAFAAGLVSNSILLAIVSAVWMLASRFRT